VEAYDRALELDPSDPNVLTDQGVMFRRLGWFDRAVENFTKASEIDPSHRQSLYNLGIVYRYDLQDFEKAGEAWEKFLALNPSGPGSDQVRAELEALKGHPAIPKPN
jgi:tetratricopeptide (TPR) repeat protein